MEDGDESMLSMSNLTKCTAALNTRWLSNSHLVRRCFSINFEWKSFTSIGLPLWPMLDPSILAIFELLKHSAQRHRARTSEWVKGVANVSMCFVCIPQLQCSQCTFSSSFLHRHQWLALFSLFDWPSVKCHWQWHRAQVSNVLWWWFRWYGRLIYLWFNVNSIGACSSSPVSALCFLSALKCLFSPVHFKMYRGDLYSAGTRHFPFSFSSLPFYQQFPFALQASLLHSCLIDLFTFLLYKVHFAFTISNWTLCQCFWLELLKIFHISILLMPFLLCPLFAHLILLTSLNSLLIFHLCFDSQSGGELEFTFVNLNNFNSISKSGDFCFTIVDSII